MNSGSQKTIHICRSNEDFSRLHRTERLNSFQNTWVIRKVSTVCAYLSRILETVTLRTCVDFLFQSRSHKHHFMKFVLCYVCSCVLNIFKTIEGAADCETRSVICFLNTRNVLPSEIHHQICQVYGDNAMSDGMVRKWVRMFNEG